MITGPTKLYSFFDIALDSRPVVLSLSKNYLYGTPVMQNGEVSTIKITLLNLHLWHASQGQMWVDPQRPPDERDGTRKSTKKKIVTACCSNSAFLPYH